jgi:hypothetical protein
MLHYVLSYNLNFVFFISNLSLGIKHRFLLLHFDPILCRLCIHVLYHIKMNNFVKVTFLESIILKAKSKFESNVFKRVEKTHFINFNLFCKLSIINVKIPSNFEKVLCTFDKKKNHLKFFFVHFKVLSALDM